MVTLMLSIVVIVALFAAMMVGVLMGRAPIKGSCGGVGSQAECPCGRTPTTCGARKDSGSV
ncbi:MAG: (Na+)-NQR maturation NqrM [Wenzhouxiangella sp.]|nr:MAG: (Na+)-NQR maturation NqrM [Wenzhouxiangella sp.]